MRVRAATGRDLDRLAALVSLLFAHHGAGGARFALAPGGDAALTDLVRTLARDSERALLVAESAGGRLDGFVLASLLRRGPPFAERLRGEVDWLFVREAARRSGVGRSLAAAAFAWLAAHGAGRVEVHVARGNVAGRAFWDSSGFAHAMDVLARPL